MRRPRPSPAKPAIEGVVQRKSSIRTHRRLRMSRRICDSNGGEQRQQGRIGGERKTRQEHTFTTTLRMIR